VTVLLCCGVLFRSTSPQAQSSPIPNQWGERFNSEGAKLNYREIGRTEVGGRMVITYNLYASGLPKDANYALWMLSLGGKPQPVADAYISDQGKVVNVLANPQQHIAEDPINVKVSGARGEPFKFAIISEDESFRAFAEIVPVPMEAVSGDCHLTATETAPYYLSMSIRVTGLQPNEDLTVNTHSGSEGGEVKAKADDHGDYNAVVLPAVKGKRSGKAQFQVVSSGCKIGIEFLWGDGSQKYQ
jgi:hypothetical protein